MALKSHALFGAKPKAKLLAPPETASAEIPKCIFCQSNRSGKTYMEAGIVADGKFVFRFKGVVHGPCAEAALDKYRK